MYDDELNKLKQAKKFPLAKEIGAIGLIAIIAVGLSPAVRYIRERSNKCENQDIEIRQIKDSFTPEENYRTESAPTTAPYTVATRPSD
ncbi:hypothetical protein J4402_01160 [Candidatus Pacearchaeota archaeon]|nr:hypothetical protein [Candidatus Pacearchaeota archaeon]